MRDPNPPKKVNTCSFCTPGVTHIINPINYPNDIQASPDNLGRWKCGNCIDRELQDRIIRVTPNSERAKEILQERRLKAEADNRFKQRKRNQENECKEMNGKLKRSMTGQMKISIIAGSIVASIGVGIMIGLIVY